MVVWVLDAGEALWFLARLSGPKVQLWLQTPGGV